MEMKIHLLVLSLTSIFLVHPTSAICVKRNASMQQFGASIARPVAPPATQSVTLTPTQSSQTPQSDPTKSLEAQKNQISDQPQPSTPVQTPPTQPSTPAPPPAQPTPTQQTTASPARSDQPPPTQQTKPTPTPAKPDQPVPPTQQVQPTPLDSPDGPVPSTSEKPPAQPSPSTPLDSPDGQAKPAQLTPVDSPDGPVPENPVDSPDGPVPANPIDSPDGAANPVDSPDGAAPLDSPDGPVQPAPHDPLNGPSLAAIPFLNIPGVTVGDPQTAGPSPGKASKGIQELCGKTDFPDVCMSLIPPNTNADPATVLRALINVGKEKAKAAMDASKKMSAASPPSDIVASTLDVCHETYDDTISNFDSALAALDKHDTGTLMTMLSGALTSTGTCADSFTELPGVTMPVGSHDDPITTITRICLAFGDMIK